MKNYLKKGSITLLSTISTGTILASSASAMHQTPRTPIHPATPNSKLLYAPKIPHHFNEDISDEEFVNNNVINAPLANFAGLEFFGI